MRAQTPLLKVVVLFVLFAVVAVPSWGTSIHVRGGSGYGQSAGFNDCLSGTFATDSGGNACEAFNLNSVGTATLDGVISFNVFEFGFNSGDGNSPSSFYILDLGSLASGTVFTLSSSLFNAADAEVFSCNTLDSPQAFVTDSGGTTMSGPCTPNLTTAPLDFTNGQFTLNQSISGDLVLDFPVTAAAATAEPTSLALLGFGLVALAGKLRRKQA
jgi:PEP-CTERM motif